MAQRDSPLALAVTMYGSCQVSPRLRMSTWASIADPGSARVTPGSTTLRHPSLPLAGNQPREKANTWMSSSPTKNVGSEMPTAGSRLSSTRAGRHWT